MWENIIILCINDNILQRAAYVNDWINVANNARADLLFNVTQLQAAHEHKGGIVGITTPNT